jgi:MerR family transcriptional regulator, thiopeptide resistance regulator
MSRQDGTWRIGELARETGLTVRTLHHYDQLGLLSPLARTEGGHRCYTSGDVRRLHRIVALRSLGISLEQIGTLLDGDPDPAGLLRGQLDVTEERIRKATDLRARLLDVLDGLSRNAEPSARQLLQLIEETVAMNEPLTCGCRKPAPPGEMLCGCRRPGHATVPGGQVLVRAGVR